MHPSEGIGSPSLLDIQDLLSDLGGDGADLQLLVDGDVVVHSAVLDVLHSADDDCSPRPEALQQLSLLLPLDHLIDEDLPLRDLVLLLVAEQLQDGVAGDSGQDQVLQRGGGDLDLASFLPEDEEDVGGADLDHLVAQQPQRLLVSLLGHFGGGLQGGGVVAEC